MTKQCSIMQVKKYTYPVLNEGTINLFYQLIDRAQVVMVDKEKMSLNFYLYPATSYLDDIIYDEDITFMTFNDKEAFNTFLNFLEIVQPINKKNYFKIVYSWEDAKKYVSN